MKFGIVGLPNVGKSTLFNLLCKSKKAKAEDYPFCTIEPNITIVNKYDHRLAKLATEYKSEKTIYTKVEIVDIAGLIKNASEGEGLGNKFLTNIRNVDSIIHVVRDFEGAMHVYDENDCQRDFDIINMEFLIADTKYLEKKLAKCKKNSEKEEIKYIMNSLDQGIKIDKEKYAHYDLFSLKPQIILINGDKKDKSPIEKEKVIFLNVGELECMVNDFGEESEEIDKSIADLINSAHTSLNRIEYFTVGPKEARAWSIKVGSTAREAAGKIHSDFAKKFVKAEISSWEKPEEKRLVGPDYIVQDGDVILFRVSA